jgi:LytS/YehU family sensor histidine kinase
MPLDTPHAEAFDGVSMVEAMRNQRVRAVLWLTLIFWVSNLGLLTIGTALAGNPRLDQIIAVRVGELLLGLLFSFGIHLMLCRLPTTRKRLVALAIVAPIAAEAFAWTAFFAEAAVDPTLTLKLVSWAATVRTIAFWTWFFLAWAGTYLAVSYSFDVQEEQRLAAEVRERAHVAQLQALHSQINPHFLFNSLNSVAALILDHKIRLADEMVTKLAHFLRLGLAADPREKIPLSAELELQRTYLEIEQLRYDDLEISIEIGPGLEDAKLPTLILQPIVENAVKYGVAGAPPPASIMIKAWSEGSRLLLEVIDSGKGTKKTSGSGIGLANVRERLRLIYGDESELLANSMEDGGFRVRLAFPLDFE